MTMVIVRAMPYVAASALDDWKPSTIRIVQTTSAQFTWGT